MNFLSNNFFVFSGLNYLQLNQQIDQSSLVLPRSTLVDPSSDPSVMTAYADYITGSAKAISNSLNSGATDSDIARDVEAMWKFESDLAKVNIKIRP